MWNHCHRQAEITPASGHAYELCGRLDDAFGSYGDVTGYNILADNPATRALFAAAHIGLGWVLIRRWQQHHLQEPQQRPTNHKNKEKAFQVAHVHFLTALKLSSSSTDASTTAAIGRVAVASDALAMKLRLHSGLAASLWESRWTGTARVCGMACGADQ